MLRGRNDAERDFLVAALGPQFFPTSSGYMASLSASGKSLGREPKKALAAFQKLPESERAPGAVKVGALNADTKATPPAPPAGGLVLKSHGRFLARESDGTLRHVSMKDFPLMADYKEDRIERVGYLFEAHPDFVWLTEAEWQALIPEQPKAGDKVEVAENIVYRLCRYHLIPGRLYGEGGGFSGRGIRDAKLTVIVDKVSDGKVHLRLDGYAHLGSVYEAEKATTPNGPLPLGYEPRLTGVIEYDIESKQITRFDMVALGDAWGRMGDANGKTVSVERPLRHPIGFAFELADPSIPANRLIPSGRAARVRPGGVYWK